MASDPRSAYLQARLQARHGDRPGADDWRLIEASADLSHFLEAIRRSALKRWVTDLNPDMDPQAIERALRSAWRDTVDQVAGWAPPAWGPAVSWLRWLPDLPAIDHLMRGGKVPPWMRSDPVMRALAYDEPQRRREALAELPIAALHPEAADGQPRVVEAWVEAWLARLPDAGRLRRAELEAVLEAVRRHIETMRSSEDLDGRALRNALATRLLRGFRHGAGTATAMFCHLLLDGLELERVRAGVMTRRLLPQRVEGRSWA
jgi:hypothetical protein